MSPDKLNAIFRALKQDLLNSILKGDIDARLHAKPNYADKFYQFENLSTFLNKILNSKLLFV